jgi:hypothetical protein
MRWLENTENDLLESKLKIWRQEANNREGRASVVKEAKVLGGLN